MSSRFIFPLISIGAGITPADGAKLKFQVANTFDDKNTFEDEGLITSNANPVIADGIGHFPDIWVPDRERYKVTLLDKNDVQIVVLDPVITPLGNDNLTQVFDNVADMQADTSLKIGDVVRFRNYFANLNGGANEGTVVATSAGTVDGGRFIDLPNTTPPTLFKGEFPGHIVHVEQYGAKSGDLTAAAANTIALNNANLNDLFKRVHYLGGKYSVDDSIMFRSDYQYRGLRDSTEIECLFDKNIMVSEAFVSAQGVGPTGKLSIHNIRARGVQTNLNQIGCVFFDFGMDLQFVEPITCGGGGLHCVDRDDADALIPGTLVNNRIENCRVSRCLGILFKMGDEALSNKITDYFIDNLILAADVGTTSHFFASTVVGSEISNILFEGVTSTIVDVATFTNARSSRILGCHIASFPNRGFVFPGVQEGLIVTGLSARCNSCLSGARLIDIAATGIADKVPSVVIQATVDLTQDTSGFAVPIVIVNNQAIVADIQVTVATGGKFASQLVLAGGLDQNRIDQVRFLRDSAIVGRVTDRGGVSDQLGLSHDSRRLGYAEIPPGVSGNIEKIVNFTIKLQSNQELIPRLKIIASTNNGPPVNVRYKQDLFLSSKDNAVDQWFLGECPAEVMDGFAVEPVLRIVRTIGTDVGLLEVKFTFSNNTDFGILQLNF